MRLSQQLNFSLCGKADEGWDLWLWMCRCIVAQRRWNSNGRGTTMQFVMGEVTTKRKRADKDDDGGRARNVL